MRWDNKRLPPSALTMRQRPLRWSPTCRPFRTTVTNFDAAQGGIFEARFDNELLGNTSTLGAEVAAMVKGLQTGNAALVAAAAEEMHANAADVGGNNLPATGGTYNPDGLTVADVLSTRGCRDRARRAGCPQLRRPRRRMRQAAARADAHGHNRRCRRSGAGRPERRCETRTIRQVPK